MSAADVDVSYDFVDYEAITVSSTPVGLTATKIQPAGGRKRRGAVIHIATNACRYRLDPEAHHLSTTTGIVVAAGDEFTVDGHNNLSQLRLIASATDGAAQVHYYE